MPLSARIIISPFCPSPFVTPETTKLTMPVARVGGLDALIPTHVLGTYDPEVFCQSELEHVVQQLGSNGQLGYVVAIRLRAQPVADNALPS